MKCISITQNAYQPAPIKNSWLRHWDCLFSYLHKLSPTSFMLYYSVHRYLKIAVELKAVDAVYVILPPYNSPSGPQSTTASNQLLFVLSRF